MQRTMLEHQSKLILEMTNKIKRTTIEDEMRNELPHYPSVKDEHVKNDGLHQCVEEKPKNFKQLYKKVKNGQKYEMEDNSSNDVSDNDSFITINTSDEDSDYTLDTSESSDSGIIDSFGSYGVNPLFSKSIENRTSTTSRACKEFVYIRQNEEKRKVLEPAADHEANVLKMKSFEKSQRASVNHSQRKIVIMHDKSAMIVNESCLI